MEAHLELADSRATESVAVSHKFEEPGEFFYENERVSMPATGSVLVGETTYSLPEGSSFDVLDWGRGVWPENVRWEWGHFAGMLDGRLVGIDLGTVNGDDSPGTADAVIVDGVLNKLKESNWTYDLDERRRRIGPHPHSGLRRFDDTEPRTALYARALDGSP